MKQTRSTYFKGAAAALALAALGTAGVAQARSDVYWSVGVNAAPGVTLGVGNAYPVYPAAYPYYSAPVYVAPPVTYYPSTYYVRPAPVVYTSGYYYGPTYYRSGKHRHHRHHRHDAYRY
jgi:hypothetical protein